MRNRSFNSAGQEELVSKRAEAGRATFVLLPLAARFAHIFFLHGGYYFSLSFSGYYGGSFQE